MGTGLVKSRFTRSGRAGAPSSGMVVLFFAWGATPRIPSSRMIFLTLYNVVPSNSAGRLCRICLAPKIRLLVSHTARIASLSLAHGSGSGFLESHW